MSAFALSLDLLVAEANRRMRKRRLLILAAALLVAGGVASAGVTMRPAFSPRPAAACPVTGGYYAYAIPEDPAHPPAAGSGPTSWGWTPRKSQVEVGDRMNLNGHLWQVTEIAAMPGVEPVGRPFGIVGWPMPSFRRLAGKLLPVQRAGGNTSLTMCGRLVFRPVN